MSKSPSKIQKELEKIAQKELAKIAQKEKSKKTVIER